MFWLAQEFCWEMLKLSKKLPFLPLPYPVTVVKMKKENLLKTLNNKEHKNFSHLAYYEFVKASGKASTSFSLAQA